MTITSVSTTGFAGKAIIEWLLEDQLGLWWVEQDRQDFQKERAGGCDNTLKTDVIPKNKGNSSG